MAKDINYTKVSIEEFEGEFLEVLSTLQEFGEVKAWRAPSNKCNKAMKAVIDKHGLDSVLGDLFAVDPDINDAKYCADRLVANTQDGSIAIIHMPSKNWRRWCLEELQLFCEEVTKKGFKIISYSEMKELATA